MPKDYPRSDRISQQIKKEIADILSSEIKDPALKKISIIDVEVAHDLKNAKVYVMPLGGKQKLEVIDSLNKVKSHIKKLISSGITLRQIPKINFIIDNSFEYAKHIDQILHKIKN